ncbi:MAG: hypothetical protein ACRDOY_03525 [Nocardioidaceae bacterium]
MDARQAEVCTATPRQASSEQRLADLMRLAVRQDGVLSRQQVLDHGLTDAWLNHRISSYRWQRVHTGVYAVFTGPLAWSARCWAAVLFYGEGAALAGETAISRWMRDGRSVDSDSPIVVAVDHDRRVTHVAGTELWRVSGLAAHVHPATQPPRLRLEVAVLLTASRARRADDAVAMIADACQSRRTTAARLHRALLERLPANVRFRVALRETLRDVATGAYSYLELQYLRRVERPHGLPTGSRQRRVRQGRRVWFRDVEYVSFRIVVELDGRLGHESLADRADDLDRDNAVARAGRHTTRLSYRPVTVDTRSTAQLVVDELRSGGWQGKPKCCSPSCPVR